MCVANGIIYFQTPLSSNKGVISPSPTHVFHAMKLYISQQLWHKQNSIVAYIHHAHISLVNSWKHVAS